MLGILGGMGPLATVDFLQKLVMLTQVKSDQLHIPTVVWSVPQIPDRSTYIINAGENPFPALRKGALSLQSIGASVIAMPCNTAHFWADSITQNTGIPILHIVDAVIDELNAQAVEKSLMNVGIMATTGTVSSNIYQSKLTTAGWNTIIPTDKDQKSIMEGINLAKSGQLPAAKKLFLEQIRILRQQGANKIVLGCTELPAVLEKQDDVIDSNLALASRCVRWFNATYTGV